MTTEQLILEAAEAVFLEKGFAAARTNEISLRAGVNHALLHYYFRTKENIFEKVLNKNLNELAQTLVCSFGTESRNGKEAILNGVRAHFEALRNKPQLPKFIVTEVYCNEQRAQLMKEFISCDLLPVRKSIETSLKEIGADVDAETLLFDIIVLNCFPFLTLPVIKTVRGDVDSFLDARINENVTLISRRI